MMNNPKQVKRIWDHLYAMEPARLIDLKERLRWDAEDVKDDAYRIRCAARHMHMRRLMTDDQLAQAMALANNTECAGRRLQQTHNILADVIGTKRGCDRIAAHGRSAS